MTMEKVENVGKVRFHARCFKTAFDSTKIEN